MTKPHGCYGFIAYTPRILRDRRPAHRQKLSGRRRWRDIRDMAAWASRHGWSSCFLSCMHRCCDEMKRIEGWRICCVRDTATDVYKRDIETRHCSMQWWGHWPDVYRERHTEARHCSVWLQGHSWWHHSHATFCHCCAEQQIPCWPSCGWYKPSPQHNNCQNGFCTRIDQRLFYKEMQNNNHQHLALCWRLKNSGLKNSSMYAIKCLLAVLCCLLLCKGIHRYQTMMMCSHLHMHTTCSWIHTCPETDHSIDTLKADACSFVWLCLSQNQLSPKPDQWQQAENATKVFSVKNATTTSF